MIREDYLTIDLGCGNKKSPNAIGFDLYKLCSVDVIGDIHRLPFKDDSFDKVIASNILEHSSDPIDIIQNIHRITKPNGIVEIIVPHAFSVGSYVDPTHKSFFTLGTMDYFTKDCELNYYCKAQFEILKRSLGVYVPRLGRFTRILTWFFNLKPYVFENLFKLPFIDGSVYWLLKVIK